MAEVDLQTDLAVAVSRELMAVLKGKNPEICEKALAVTVATLLTGYKNKAGNPDLTRQLRTAMLMTFCKTVAGLIPLIDAERMKSVN